MVRDPDTINGILLMSAFATLNLAAPILSSLTSAGYEKMTPIQEQSIPHLLEGKDLLGIAQTGTGKTAAFALPIINHLFNHPLKVLPGHARFLVLTPTRELASQIHASFAKYSNGIKMHNAVVFGGVGERDQVMAMRKGVDVLIATPGRLLDLMGQGYIRLGHLEFFVLDEADRMLDMGFINDVKKVIRHLPTQRQTLLFSATMPPDISRLAQSLLKNPLRVEVTPESTTVEKISQKLIFVDKRSKPMLLRAILNKEKIDRVLVFTRTKHGANKVVEQLERFRIGAAAIHGNKSQTARERALNGFRNGTINVLVATDIASRGIDVKGISHVINYDLPNEPEAYVHRIGRTARAGKEGVAISFCDETEHGHLKDVERTIRCKIPVVDAQLYSDY